MTLSIQMASSCRSGSVSFLLGLIFLLGLFGGLDISVAAQLSLSKGDQVEIPAIRLISGEELPAGHYEGRPVVISYWASWCPYCKRQNERLQDFYPRARAKGLEILTINVDEDQEAALSYLEAVQPNFPSAFETEHIRAVFGKATFIPRVVVLDGQGTVVEVIPGEMTEKDLFDLIKYAPLGER